MTGQPRRDLTQQSAAFRSTSPGSGDAPAEPGLGRCPPGPRRAVALSFDPARDDAPVVTAVGEGLVADEIVRRAREAGVTITEDRQLAAVLSQLDLGKAVPPELYAVVAEVLCYVYQLEASASGGNAGSGGVGDNQRSKAAREILRRADTSRP